MIIETDLFSYDSLLFLVLKQVTEKEKKILIMEIFKLEHFEILPVARSKNPRFFFQY